MQGCQCHGWINTTCLAIRDKFPTSCPYGSGIQQHLQRIGFLRSILLRNRSYPGCVSLPWPFHKFNLSPSNDKTKEAVSCTRGLFFKCCFCGLNGTLIKIKRKQFRRKGPSEFQGKFVTCRSSTLDRIWKAGQDQWLRAALEINLSSHLVEELKLPYNNTVLHRSSPQSPVYVVSGYFGVMKV